MEPTNLKDGVPPGLPHGRRWVRDRWDCTCDLCATIDPEMPTYEAPHTDVRWKTTRSRDRVVVGPVGVVVPGELVEVYGHGRHQEVRVVKVGRSFERDGKWMVYGYLHD